MTTVYKIVCKDTSIKDTYLDKTKNFKRCQIRHKYRYDNNYDIKLYKFIRENGGYDNFEFVIISVDDYYNKIKEQMYIDLVRPTLNSTDSFHQDLESQKKESRAISAIYIIENKEKIKEYKKNYWIQNRESINKKSRENYVKYAQRRKEYREANKERIKTYHKEYFNLHKNKERQKEYYNANKEHIKTYHKEYYLKNLKEKQRLIRLAKKLEK